MRAFISLGSNLGDRERQLRQAVGRLRREPGVKVRTVSRIRETEPEGVQGQPRFLNAVAELETDLDPQRLMARLLQIEAEFGRERQADAPRWAPRTLDLDLLLYGDLVVESESVRVPHPRMCERRFVLEPLADLVPDLVIPGAEGRTVRECLRALSE
jgi:2-amino-4-hydroxy-6-hydroxymethyldihydropteridine diphosphokinase